MRTEVTSSHAAHQNRRGNGSTVDIGPDRLLNLTHVQISRAVTITAIDTGVTEAPRGEAGPLRTVPPDTVCRNRVGRGGARPGMPDGPARYRRPALRPGAICEC